MAQMLLCHQGNLVILPQHKIRTRKYQSANLCLNKRQIIAARQRDVDLDKNAEASIERIRERFGKVDLSISSYDTAWVAMVPSKRDSPNHNHIYHQPSFPDCLEWVMENQKADGSWGLDLSHPSLVKDSLSSTLACVLALQKWKVGENLVQKGLDFIGSKKYAVMDRYQSSPIGFDIIFPGMINYANNLGLNLPLDSAFIDLMLRNRDLKLQSCKGSRLAYFAEGLGESYDWKETIKNEQRSNGSLFNSPATTAAALISLHDDKCFDYLDSLLKIHGKAVPTIYPFDIFTRLCMVDTIDRLGINRYFGLEIKVVLDEAYRGWEQRNEEIFSDVACCVIAFRLLRMNGYHVSSDALEGFVDQEHFFNTVSPQFTNTETIVQLYRASQITLFQKEPILDKINGWTTSFLRHQLLNQDIYEEKLHNEVEYAFEYPIDNLTQVTKRRGIELYNIDNFRMLKTSCRCSSVDNKDFLILSQQEFNKIQDIHLEECKEVENWDGDSNISALGYCSERIQIIFLGLTDIINEQAAKGFIAQGRCIKHELIQIWRTYCKSCLKEVEWLTNKSTPTLDEYLANGIHSSGIGLFNTINYFMGIELSEDIVNSQEYQTLYWHAGIILRLFNDYQGAIDKRDSVDRNMNACSLIVSHNDGAKSIEEARTEVRRMIESRKRELLRMMVTEPSSTRKKLIEFFFYAYQASYYLYKGKDEYRTPTRKGLDDVNGLLYQPLNLLPSNIPEEKISTSACMSFE